MKEYNYMVTADDLISGRDKLSLTGLGYVGLPIAVAFAEKVGVIGYDASAPKIAKLLAGEDPTGEVGSEALSQSATLFTDDPTRLKESRFHIIAVPTPVTKDHSPDLEPLISASRMLGSNLNPGSIVVYESTVYPGVTEDICVPILENVSGLKCGAGFKVGYSPERINPGDKEHRLENIIKVVSGMDEATTETIAAVYSLAVKAGIYKASSIKVAEAAKVIENSQRDINIAFMNELAIIFDKMGIPTADVLEAAGTKWNFLNFTPGLVGGHCIGVDPYYLTHAAEKLGYHSRIILQGRHINDAMGSYVAQRAVKMLSRAGQWAEPIADRNAERSAESGTAMQKERSAEPGAAKQSERRTGRPIANSKVAILGFTFKEDCPDTRNTKVIDIIKELREYGIEPIVSDPVADTAEIFQAYGIKPVCPKDICGMDMVIIAVKHAAFSSLDIEVMLADDGIVFDLKGMLRKEQVKRHEYCGL